MLALAVFALLDREKNVLDLERLLSGYRGPLIALAVGGFIVAVIGHLLQSKAAIVTGILLISMAILIFPIALYVRGAP
jgi:cytochrome c oxidase subunit IV